VKAREEAIRWLRQAESDLDTAAYLRRGRRHYAACFYAQQAGEKALNAFLFAHEVLPPPLHSMARLLDLCASLWKPIGKLEEAVRRLDRFYTASRYPNNLPSPEYPAVHFTKTDSAEALRWAEAVVGTVRSYLEGRGFLEPTGGPPGR